MKDFVKHVLRADPYADPNKIAVDMKEPGGVEAGSVCVTSPEGASRWREEQRFESAKVLHAFADEFVKNWPDMTDAELLENAA